MHKDHSVPLYEKRTGVKVIPEEWICHAEPLLLALDGKTCMFLGQCSANCLLQNVHNNSILKSRTVLEIKARYLCQNTDGQS